MNLSSFLFLNKSFCLLFDVCVCTVCIVMILTSVMFVAFSSLFFVDDLILIALISFTVISATVLKYFPS